MCQVLYVLRLKSQWGNGDSQELSHLPQVTQQLEGGWSRAGTQVWFWSPCCSMLDTWVRISELLWQTSLYRRFIHFAFNTPYKPMRWAALLSPFYRGDGGSERKPPFPEAPICKREIQTCNFLTRSTIPQGTAGAFGKMRNVDTFCHFW